MRARSAAFATVLALAAASGAQAHGLSVPLNHSLRLPLAGPAQSVVVGSPSVVDVAVVDSRTVYVSGKAPGDTDVTVIDPLGRVVFRGDVKVAGGSSVSVFRGSARTDANCAPYCRELPPDQTATITPPGMPGLPSLPGAPAGGTGQALANGTTTTLMSSQTISSIPSALHLPH